VPHLCAIQGLNLALFVYAADDRLLPGIQMGSIAAKVSTRFLNKLAGVMVWELMQDTTSSALLNTSADCMPKPVNPGDPSTYNFENGTQGWTTSTPYTTAGTSTT
jgi:GH18 family chitinase